MPQWWHRRHHVLLLIWIRRLVSLLLNNLVAENVSSKGDPTCWGRISFICFKPTGSMTGFVSIATFVVVWVQQESVGYR